MKLVDYFEQHQGKGSFILIKNKLAICNVALLAIVFLLALPIAPAFSQCTSPTAPDGAIEYNSTDTAFELCSGTAWVTILLSDVLTACTTSQSQAREYDSSENAYKLCDGSNWEKIDCVCPDPAEDSKITVSGSQDNDYFGQSTSISGNYAVITAPYEDGAGTDRGSAYLFNISTPSSPVEEAEFTASDAQDNDRFGIGASMDGNYALIGADYEDGAGTDRGAAYLFDISTPSSPVQDAKITASDTQDNDRFGWGVALDGNYALIGADYEDGAGTDRGAAYLFDISTPSSPVQDAKITASDAQDGDRFGYHVSIDGNYALIGAPYENGHGAAYLFDISTPSSPVQEAKFTASDIESGDRFGWNVALSGNYALVGASHEDGAGTERGAAYLFDISTPSSPVQKAKLTASDAQDSDRLGHRVALDGNFALIGVTGEDGAGTDRGAAYLFNISAPSSPVEEIKFTASDAQDNDYFGNSVALDGNNVLLGAPFEDGASSNYGAAYIFSGVECSACTTYGTCSVAGEVERVSGNYRWCDGTNWKQWNTAP